VAQQIVDGLALPVAVSGHPALELCNSVAGWSAPDRKDYLRSYDHLALLARESGLIDPELARQARQLASAEPGAAAAVLGTARALREDLYAVLTRHPPPPPAAERLASLVCGQLDALSLGSATRPEPARWHPAAEAGVRLPLVAFALATFRLLDSGQGDQVSACPGAGCGWLFLNESGRRRWCIMAVCGNRAKARRFADRHRTE
jgi:predicted RNA-binding Zn ribbon-like protein